MREHAFWFERGDAAALRAEPDEDTGNARRARRFAVGRGVADHHRAAHRAAGTQDRLRQMAGIGLPDRERVRPDYRMEERGDPEFLQQELRQPLRLVGADAEPPAGGGKCPERRLRPVVKFRMVRHRAGVMFEQPRIERFDEVLVHLPRALHPEPEHRPPTPERHRLVMPGLESAGDTRLVERGVRRGDEVARCVGKRAVEIEDRCPQFVLRFYPFTLCHIPIRSGTGSARTGFAQRPRH